MFFSPIPPFTLHDWIIIKRIQQLFIVAIQMKQNKTTPGLIVLLGSGETLPFSGAIHDLIAQRLDNPPKIAILETPAGFEPNSDQVAGKIAQFLEKRLQNFHPTITVVPVRKQGTAFSPNNPNIVQPLFEANWLLLGPGSPTYAVRQLENSLAFEIIAAQNRLGATLLLSSAATLAFSHYTIPVYEIYKVGEDLHWKKGLDYLGMFGLSLVIVPHWNNQDGGDELDTSRCYIGQRRFAQLCQLLPSGHTIVGLDENTGLVIDPENECCLVMGKGSVTLLREDEPNGRIFAANTSFPVSELGNWHLPVNGEGIKTAVWEQTLATRKQQPTPTATVLNLLEQRQAARDRRDWATADQLREQILTLGWQIKDTSTGSQLEQTNN